MLQAGRIIYLHVIDTGKTLLHPCSRVEAHWDSGLSHYSSSEKMHHLAGSFTSTLSDRKR